MNWLSTPTLKSSRIHFCQTCCVVIWFAAQVSWITSLACAPTRKTSKKIPPPHSQRVRSIFAFWFKPCHSRWAGEFQFSMILGFWLSTIPNFPDFQTPSEPLTPPLGPDEFSNRETTLLPLRPKIKYAAMCICSPFRFYPLQPVCPKELTPSTLTRRAKYSPNLCIQKQGSCLHTSDPSGFLVTWCMHYKTQQNLSRHCVEWLSIQDPNYDESMIKNLLQEIRSALTLRGMTVKETTKP